MKIQFAAGPNILEGWLNLQESNGDITKPLAFKNESASHIFVEHGIEHITHQEAWRFFEECYRILKPKGVVRIVVPSVDKIWRLCTPDYKSFITESAPQWWTAAGLDFSKFTGTAKDCVETIIFCHGHKACWNGEMLETFLGAVGFDVMRCAYGCSNHPELKDVDSHWHLMGLERCKMESVVCEGTKP